MAHLLAISNIQLGTAMQNSQGDWVCSSGPPAIVPNPHHAPIWPKSTTDSFLLDRVNTPPTAAIVGGVVGGFTLFLLLLAIILRKKDAWGATDNILAPKASEQNSGIEGEGMPLQSQQGWISRVLLFLALETAYIALVSIACIQPITLTGISLGYLIEAKGVTTIIAITWQTIALLPIKDIASAVFSSEWSHSFWRTRELIPGKTDNVSVQTAGLLDRLKHFVTIHSTWAFRLALPLSLLSVALAGIGPGALTVTLIFIPTAARIDVGSIDITRIGNNFLPTERAGLFTRVEQVERGRYGFNIAEPGVIVGWPRFSSYDFTGNFTYPSDIVRFNYECHWAAPALMGKSSDGWSVSSYGMWAVDGKKNQEELWTTYGDKSHQKNARTGMSFKIFL
jgi:hypothetical protein